SVKTSNIVERVSRAIIAIGPVASAITGSTICDRLVQRATGKTSTLIANCCIKSVARMKFGIEIPNTAIEIGRHTSELQSRFDLVCRLLLEKKENIREMIIVM